jgi:DNA-cytosine methyltransferase
MGLNVLSLFDGMSCGMIALERSGVSVDNYFASEVDKHAIKVSQKNYPGIIQVGDVTQIDVSKLPKIDLLIGGSPCQGFSMAGKQIAFDDPRSMLYFEYERILKELKLINPNIKFLLENVKMKQEFKDVITSRLGVEPVAINSNLVSAQNRYRLYWTNIESIIQPEDKGICLKDILEETVEQKYFIKAGRLKWLNQFGEEKEKEGYVAFNPNKSKCLTVRGEPSWNTTYIVQPVREVGRRLDSNGIRCDDDKSVPITRQYEVGTSGKSNCITTVQKDSLIIKWPHGGNKGGLRAIDGETPALTTSSWPANNLLLSEGLVRKLTPVECERLQTVPDGYTSCVSDTQRYKMLGNGWTVDVIAHIFQGLKEEPLDEGVEEI